MTGILCRDWLITLELLQAMDTSHVSLVSVLLQSSGFEDYRCDTNCIMGISLKTMIQVIPNLFFYNWIVIDYIVSYKAGFSFKTYQYTIFIVCLDKSKNKTQLVHFLLNSLLSLSFCSKCFINLFLHSSSLALGGVIGIALPLDVSLPGS